MSATSWGIRFEERPVSGRAHAPAAPLEGRHVAPGAGQIPQPRPDADDPEAAALVEGDRRRVLREDPRLQRPDARVLRSVDERVEQPPPDAAAARVGADVDADLRDPAVGAALRDLRE